MEKWANKKIGEVLKDYDNLSNGISIMKPLGGDGERADAGATQE